MPASTSTNSTLDAAIDEARLGADANGAGAERSVNELARRAERAIQEGLETLRSQGRGYADTAAERLDSAQQYVVEKVHERPLTSALTALGIGVVVGMLLTGRRH